MAARPSRCPHSRASCSTATSAVSTARSSEPDFFARPPPGPDRRRAHRRTRGVRPRAVLLPAAARRRSRALPPSRAERPRAGAVLEAVREFAGGMQQMRKHLALIEQAPLRPPEAALVPRGGLGVLRRGSALPEQLGDARAAVPRLRRAARLPGELCRIATRSPRSCTRRETLSRTSSPRSRYAVHIRGNRVQGQPVRGRAGHERGDRAHVREVQAGRGQGLSGAASASCADMNHVEAQILELVAKLHPETFSKLEQYCTRHARYLDADDRPLRSRGPVLPRLSRVHRAAEGTRPSRSRYPRVSARSKDVRATETFDLALAVKLAGDGAPVVCNDFHLADPERILVVSGPNNGGKTTFARTFGQLHYLASLGLPVPGSGRAAVPARPDLHPLRAGGGHRRRFAGSSRTSCSASTRSSSRRRGASVLIMNESFGSTTLRDALARRHRGDEADHRARRAVRVRDVRGRAVRARTRARSA